MSSVVIWFVALVTVIGSSNTVESSPAHNLDLSKVLRFMQQLQHKNPNKHRILRMKQEVLDSDYTSSDSHTDSNISDDSNRKRKPKSKEELIDFFVEISKNGVSRLGPVDNKRLENARIIDLIEAVSSNEKETNGRIAYHKGKLNHGWNSKNYDGIISKNNNQKQILELLSQTPHVGEHQRRPKKKLKPNRLTPTVTMDDVNKYYRNKYKNDGVTALEDYSKIYIVLNPEAVKNSKNKNALNDLISKVLSMSSTKPKEEPQQAGPFRYKGFVVNERHSKRSVKELKDKMARMGEIQNELNQPAISFERITAMPTSN